jgi:hypothetical protein
MEPVRKIRLREPIIIFILAILLIFWAINAVNTGNMFWFSPIQPSYQPSKIVVRNYGQTVNLLPGMPGFAELTLAANDSFSIGFSNTALINLGLSDETLRRYHEEELVVEFNYDQNISFNSQIRMSNIRQLLIPIDATHSGNGYVFIGKDGEWRAGALVLTDYQSILDTMAVLGYLQEQD